MDDLSDLFDKISLLKGQADLVNEQDSDFKRGQFFTILFTTINNLDFRTKSKYLLKILKEEMEAKGWTEKDAEEYAKQYYENENLGL